MGKTFVQAVGAIITTEYEAWGLFQTAVSGVKTTWQANVMSKIGG